ncbi:MAG: hypothetical protein V1701_08255 [Planctomycetota bacterium]
MSRETRVKFIKDIETATNSKVICYLTGDRQGFGTQIAFDVIPLIHSHLEAIGKVKTIGLYLYSIGGLTMAGWRLVTLIREYCEKFIVLIPYKAQSCATLIALGADEIIMRSMGQLSPVDPTVTGPYNPQLPGPIPGAPNSSLPVSVEDVVSYLDLAKENGIKESSEIKEVFLRLANTVQPLALGNVHRARTQIRMLAKKLLHLHMKGRNIDKKIDKIVEILTQKLFSHDYLISRKEAKETIDLNIVTKPEVETLMGNLYEDYSQEMYLGSIFNPDLFLGAENSRELSIDRAFVESVNGAYAFRTKKIITRRQLPASLSQQLIFDERLLQEEWVTIEAVKKC